MEPDEASVVALRVLDWMAQADDMLGHFLSSSGMAPDDLRDNLADTQVQASILDFVLQDDAWVLAWAEHAQSSPEHILQARHALPGGTERHWT